MNRLKGKRVAVVGAGSIGEGWGNGKAAAVLFAKEGGTVLCVDRDNAAAEATCELIQQDGYHAEALALDVVTEGAGDVLIDAMQRHFGGIDVMHFNVGISSTGGVLDTTDNDWDRIFDVNLRSAFRLTRSVVPLMREQGSGALVYLSSLAATYSGPYSYVSYETSKAALCRFVRSVARENAPYGIRANTILPGVIDTPHVRSFVDSDTDPKELAERRAEMVPLGRQGTAWDIAQAALFLASDEASFVTGVDLPVDGGMSA